MAMASQDPGLGSLEVEPSWFPFQPDLGLGVRSGGRQGGDTESVKCHGICSETQCKQLMGSELLAVLFQRNAWKFLDMNFLVFCVTFLVLMTRMLS